MIEDVGRTLGSRMAEGVGRAMGRVQENRPLAADLLESEDAFLVVFDAPGAEAADVQVRFEDGAVFVRIDRFRSVRDGFEMLFPGRGLTLAGSVQLPDEEPVRPPDSEATLKPSGELHVRVPKVPEAAGEGDASASSREQ